MTDQPGLPGYPDVAAIRHFSLGRHALAAGLKALGVGEGDAILMPEFICRDLLASVHAVRAKPLFYPLDRRLAPSSLPAAANVKAVIAVNYFGFPQALEPFAAYCAQHDAALIEDNAHGYLSRDSEGRLLGTRGDIGLLSMRKTFALPDGAALLVNRRDWIRVAPAPLGCRDDALPLGYIVKRRLRGVQNATGIRVRSFAEQLTRGFRWLRTGHALPISSDASEYGIPGDPAVHCLAVEMLQQTDPGREVIRRRSLYQDFHQALRRLNIEPVFGELTPGVAPYGYPFRATEAEAAEVTRIAQKRGFDCSYWPDLPAAVAPQAPDFYRNVWWVNFLC